ncbi:Bug family tripartite tricarboxylate transporter substrate binding protein [Phreatobacter stygius]|nr:tripartite tricarboxylate transporter substrate-binding protein [Phreatobacter stygius]
MTRRFHDIHQRPAPSADRRAVLGALGAMLAAPTALAQSGKRRPDGNARFVVPFAPGGSVDVLGRAVAKAVSERLGHQVVVENVAGGSTNLGSERVAKSAPDGLTVLVASDSLAINKSLFRDLGFDPVSSFEPVTLAISAPQILVTHPKSGFSDVAGFIAAARARSGALTVGLPGSGVIGHLASEVVNLRLGGLKVNHIPYNGGAPATRDLIGGHLDAVYITLPAVTSQVRERSLTGLAVTSAARSKALPSVPSFAEHVIPGLDLVSWQGFLLPAGTARGLVEGWHELIAGALASPEVVRTLSGLGFDIIAQGPEAFAALIKADVARFADVVREAGLARS